MMMCSCVHWKSRSSSITSDAYFLDFSSTFPSFSSFNQQNLVDLDELDLELEGRVGGNDGGETSSTVGYNVR